MIRLIAALMATCLLAAPLHADCVGQDLMASMPAETRAVLTAQTDAVPYPRGNLWRATRGAQVVTMVGTYHLDDPRHAQTLATVAPMIAAAKTVLVEAGPDEEKALIDHMSRNPDLMMITKGPSLIDQMPADDWQDLSQALANRGVPSMIAAKLKPWYVNVLLAIPVCTMEAAETARGLDGMVMDEAARAGVPLRALEPYDTVFGLFDLMTTDEQLGMIKATLAFEDQAEDFATTLSEAYFNQESRLIWEFMRQKSYDLPGYTPAQIDHEFARMEEALMSSRNRKWIPVIEAAAAKGPVFAAFGALHLPGQEGVLALLEKAGFTLERLPL